MQYEGFVIYRSFYEAIEKIPKEEQLTAYKAVMEYALNDVLPENLPLSVDIIFGLIKPQIDKNRERAKNGKKGGRPTGTKKVPALTPTPEKEETVKKTVEIAEQKTGIKQEKQEKTDKVDKTDYKKIVDTYNELCPSLPKVLKITEKRKTAIKARLKNYTEEELKEYFKTVEKSDFLTGRKGKGWKANFDWLMNESNMVKVLEGNYSENGKEKPKVKQQNSFHNLEERNYSSGYYEALEKQLTGGAAI